MSPHPKTPKLLPWLAKKAGITERRATTLWHEAERWAAHRAASGTSDYYQLAVDRLFALAEAESLREDAASFGWRPWARAQARFWAVSVQVLEETAAANTRSWQLLQPIRFG